MCNQLVQGMNKTKDYYGMPNVALLDMFLYFYSIFFIAIVYFYICIQSLFISIVYILFYSIFDHLYSIYVHFYCICFVSILYSIISM